MAPVTFLARATVPNRPQPMPVENRIGISLPNGQSFTGTRVARSAGITEIQLRNTRDPSQWLRFSVDRNSLVRQLKSNNLDGAQIRGLVSSDPIRARFAARVMTPNAVRPDDVPVSRPGLTPLQRQLGQLRTQIGALEARLQAAQPGAAPSPNQANPANEANEALTAPLIDTLTKQVAALRSRLEQTRVAYPPKDAGDGVQQMLDALMQRVADLEAAFKALKGGGQPTSLAPGAGAPTTASATPSFTPTTVQSQAPAEASTQTPTATPTETPSAPVTPAPPTDEAAADTAQAFKLAFQQAGTSAVEFVAQVGGGDGEVQAAEVQAAAANPMLSPGQRNAASRLQAFMSENNVPRIDAAALTASLQPLQAPLRPAPPAL